MTEFNYPEIADLQSQIRFSGGHGKVWLNEQRVTLMSLAALGKFRKEMINSLGMERAKGFFIRLGYQMGKLDGELARNFRVGQSEEDRFMIGPQLHALRGMVKVELVELEVDLEAGTLLCINDWIDSYEVDICRQEIGTLEEPGCWNLAGYASGYASVLMQRPVFFQEVECFSCGDSRCRVVGKPAEEWENYEQYKKYFEPEDILAEMQKLQSQVSALRESVTEQYGLDDIVSQSKSFRDALDMIRKVAESNVNVLLIGETGSGKEVLASILHQLSPRSEQPYIAVNCGAIPHDLIEAELFGVEKGAFTGAMQSRMGRFERANQGTIFLDEVVELTPRAQAALLRVIQERELERVGDTKVRQVDVRIVAATNEDLKQAVEEGRFRADLYYRLNTYPVQIPPLRKRLDDIPRFVEHFLDKYQALFGKQVLGVSDRAMEVLSNYAWPGNVRELENVIQRALILTDPGSQIHVEQLFPSTPELPDSEEDDRVIDEQGGLVQSATEPVDIIDSVLRSGMSLDELESSVLKRALESADGNVSEAARLTGLSRATFAYRLGKIQESDG